MTSTFIYNSFLQDIDRIFFSYIYNMAKSVKKKSAKEASNVFHNIMAASVAGNPKPKAKKKKNK